MCIKCQQQHDCWRSGASTSWLMKSRPYPWTRQRGHPRSIQLSPKSPTLRRIFLSLRWFQNWSVLNLNFKKIHWNPKRPQFFKINWWSVKKVNPACKNCVRLRSTNGHSCVTSERSCRAELLPKMAEDGEGFCYVVCRFSSLTIISAWFWFYCMADLPSQ